jgi:hypothetical protein
VFYPCLPLNRITTIDAKNEVQYDKTDITADDLAALPIGCPDGLQRKN